MNMFEKPKPNMTIVEDINCPVETNSTNNSEVNNMAFEKQQVQTAKKTNPNFKTVGWISSTSKGVYTVKDAENNLLGFANKQMLEKLIRGDIRGCPISIRLNQS
jgi:hypothetical protein